MIGQVAKVPNMDFLSDKKMASEIILDNLCRQIQLDSHREEVMQTTYGAVTKIISEDDGFFGSLEPLIYPYGSKAIGTTIKPLKSDEFDLDFIVKVVYNWNKITQQEFIDKLYHLLNNHGRYKGKVEKFRFCVRINYKSQFHMDIMPGCEITYKPEKLKVPDTKKTMWANRNPKGFILWFKSKFIDNISNIYLNDYYKYLHSVEMKAEVEDLPDSQPYQVTQPLQRAVQLIKRRRDVYFKDNDEYATLSIILTTIAGMFYNQETSIFDTIDGIIGRVDRLVTSRGIHSPIEIVNPADFNENEADKEKFSDKWKEGERGEKLYSEFVKFIRNLREEWNILKESSGKPDKLIGQMFGESITEKAFENRVLLANNLRKSNSLNINKATGTLTMSKVNSVNVLTNTIHGIDS